MATSGFRGGDASINRAGRKPIDRTKKVTNRERKEQELLMLLRRIKPHVAEAILSAAKIMKNDTAKHADQLKAATILLDNYRRLTLDMYAAQGQEEDEGEAIQENAQPAFSLKVINN